MKWMSRSAWMTGVCLTCQAWGTVIPTDTPATQPPAVASAKTPSAASVNAVVAALTAKPTRSDSPSYLSMQQDESTVESVYAPPSPPRDDEGVNQGGVNVAINVTYLTDYVYRGIDRSEVGGHEDAPNLQFDGTISFNLGKLPHPFVGVFANVFDSDPVSRFQEIRPYFGLEWTIRPLKLEAGNNSYIYPERDEFNTSEVYGRITLDDSYIFHTEKPVLSPYVYAAYDYDQNNGWYFEGGVKHDFVIEDTGITVTAVADIAYTLGYQQQFVFLTTDDEGLQHYDVGLIGSYSLNSLFNVSRRYGEWTFNGYLFYSQLLNGPTQPRTDNSQIWGGVGIGFKY